TKLFENCFWPELRAALVRWVAPVISLPVPRWPISRKAVYRMSIIDSVAFAIRAKRYEDYFRDNLPDHARNDFDRVLANDERQENWGGNAGSGLVWSAPNHMRGGIAVWLYLGY